MWTKMSRRWKDCTFQTFLTGSLRHHWLWDLSIWLFMVARDHSKKIKLQIENRKSKRHWTKRKIHRKQLSINHVHVALIFLFLFSVLSKFASEAKHLCRFFLFSSSDPMSEFIQRQIMSFVVNSMADMSPHEFQVE